MSQLQHIRLRHSSGRYWAALILACNLMENKAEPKMLENWQRRQSFRLLPVVNMDMELMSEEWRRKTFFNGCLALTF